MSIPSDSESEDDSEPLNIQFINEGMVFRYNNEKKKLRALSRTFRDFFEQKSLNFITDKLYTTKIILFLINNFNYVRKKQVSFQFLSTQFYNSEFNDRIKKFNKIECKEWMKYERRRRFVDTSSDED